jgi:hypothetical protein
LPVETRVSFAPRQEAAADKTARQELGTPLEETAAILANLTRSAARNMTVTDNETWIIETGGRVIRKEATGGIECLSPWEMLVYCLWVTDYGMRNAGDLDTAADVYPEFQLHARRVADELSFQLTYEAFSLPQRDLERAYFDRFESICNEIKDAESRVSNVRRQKPEPPVL